MSNCSTRMLQNAPKQRTMPLRQKSFVRASALCLYDRHLPVLFRTQCSAITAMHASILSALEAPVHSVITITGTARFIGLGITIHSMSWHAFDQSLISQGTTRDSGSKLNSSQLVSLAYRTSSPISLRSQPKQPTNVLR